MREIENEKPIVFVEGDEDRVVVEKSDYGTSLFSSQYTTAFGILKRTEGTGQCLAVARGDKSSCLGRHEGCFTGRQFVPRKQRKMMHWAEFGRWDMAKWG